MVEHKSRNYDSRVGDSNHIILSTESHTTYQHRLVFRQKPDSVNNAYIPIR